MTQTDYWGILQNMDKHMINPVAIEVDMQGLETCKNCQYFTMRLDKIISRKRSEAFWLNVTSLVCMLIFTSSIGFYFLIWISKRVSANYDRIANLTIIN